MKAIIIVLFSIFIAEGCANIDPAILGTYIYRNESSSDITVRSIGQDINSDGIWYTTVDSTFVIPKYGSHTLSFFPRGIGTGGPFCWEKAGRTKGSLFVSNGQKQFTQHAPGGRLYSIAAYTLLSSSKSKEVYQYIFTDQDFVNAEPIHP